MKIKKLPISVTMVVYNEEKLIGRALKSCADLVDDIVIIHDGPCSDNTLKIAKQFKARIFVEKHVGAPEPHRPLSFAKCKNNWVLQLDADEYLNKDFRNKLSDLIKKDVPGYTVDWIEKVGNKQFLSMTKEVLFQKNRVYFIGAPCEYIKPVNPKEKLSHASVGLVNAPKISNYQSWNFYVNKYTKLAQIQSSFYITPFRKIKKWNYKKSDWDRNTKLKIKYPVLLGILGMNVKYLIELSQKLLKRKTPSSVPAIFHQMWYNSRLYSLVFYKKNFGVN